MRSRAAFPHARPSRVRQYDKGAALFAHTPLYGQVAAGQGAVARAQEPYGPIKVPESSSDDRFGCLSDVLAAAWQAVQYADVPAGATVVIVGLGWPG